MLKFGSLKTWNTESEKSKKAIEDFNDTMSDEAIELLCKVIDTMQIKNVYIWYYNQYVGKRKAKEYVRNYWKNERDKALIPKKVVLMEHYKQYTIM